MGELWQFIEHQIQIPNQCFAQCDSLNYESLTHLFSLRHVYPGSSVLLKEFVKQYKPLENMVVSTNICCSEKNLTKCTKFWAKVYLSNISMSKCFSDASRPWGSSISDAIFNNYQCSSEASFSLVFSFYHKSKTKMVFLHPSFCQEPYTNLSMHYFGAGLVTTRSFWSPHQHRPTHSGREKGDFWDVPKEAETCTASSWFFREIKSAVTWNVW